MDNHKNDNNNPHKVSKDQIGLGYVDNTSDMDKPISTAVQAAFNEIKKLINSAMPDYSSGIGKNQGSAANPNITSRDCFLRAGGSSTANNGTGISIFIKIGNSWSKIQGVYGNGLNSLNGYLFIPIPKGTSYYVDTANFFGCTEYPVKGVN